MFLYRFVRRRRCRPQILVHAITFEQLFSFLSFLSFWHDCWPWPMDYLIRFWSILVVTLTLNFQGQIWNLLYISQKWSDCHETKSKHIDWCQGLKMWPSSLTLDMTLTLNFQGQMWNLLYLCQKWSDCHETKSKHIDWTLGLQCDHQIWPWPSPWPWIFKVKYGISYISTKSGPIATKRKANISIELQAWNVTNGLDLDHDLDIWIFKVKCELDHLVTKVRRKDLPDRDRGDFRCRRAVGSYS